MISIKLNSLIVSFLVATQILKVSAFIETEYNQGWQEYLDDSVVEYKDESLTWLNNSNKIPTWLNGSYMKNGPARRKFGGSRYYSNYMDGWAKIHKFTFHAGEVLVSGKMLETDTYKACKDAGSLVPQITLSPLRPHDWSWVEMLSVVQTGYDNTNVLVHKLGDPKDPSRGQFYATTDMADVNRINPHTLQIEQMEKFKPDGYDGWLPLAGSSHWRRDVTSNSTLATYVMFNPLTLTYELSIWKLDDSFEDRRLVGKLQLPFLPLIHQITNTPTHAVIMLCPVAMNLWRFLTSGFHPLQSYERVEGEPTRFYVMDLRNGSVVDGFESSDPSLVFSAHHINAFHDGQQVVVDLLASEWQYMTQSFDIDVMRNWEEVERDEADKSNLKRIRLDLMTRELRIESGLGDSKLNFFDFPNINPNNLGRNYRYLYGWKSLDYWKNSLLKRDLDDPVGGDRIWSMASHYPGEPFFVPNPAGESEDDGIVITVVFDGHRKQSYLLLLDGVTFQELNRAYLPHTIPYSFHGNWFPNLL